MRIFKYIFVSVLSVLAVSISATSVSAQSTSNAAQGLQISPTIVELNAARGNSYTIKLNVLNVTASDLVYNSSVQDFTSNPDESGHPVILDSKMPASASIKTWIESIPQFSLKSHQSIDITTEIKIPSNAEPGGHYGVLSFAGTAPQMNKTGVGLSASAGVLILIRVSGAIAEKADVAEFFSAKNGNQSWFFENGPVALITRIRNEGNIHIKPFGNIEVRDMFGGLVANMPVNENKSNVLPKSVRRFENSINKDWMFGPYTANLALGYGTTGQALTRTITFWVIPWRVILLAVILVAIVVYGFMKMMKVYNRHIIEKSRNENKKATPKSGKKDK